VLGCCLKGAASSRAERNQSRLSYTVCSNDYERLDVAAPSVLQKEVVVMVGSFWEKPVGFTENA